MPRVKHLYMGGQPFVSLCGEAQEDTPSKQLESIVQGCWKALDELGLCETDVVFTRLWMGDRSSTEGLSGARERLLRGRARAASSSFYSADHIVSGSGIALEMLAFRAESPSSRRLVDFSPPRRYAHYMMQDGWLFLSGMAEEGDSLDDQFTRSLTQVSLALEQEQGSWRDVVKTTLFLEKGQGSREWLQQRFISSVSPRSPQFSIEMVDGLATTSKHLEIEIIADLRKHHL